MTIASLEMIPAPRRDVVFTEIREIVDEADAVSRSVARLDGCETGWAIDDALEQILFKLNAELRRARKRRKLVVATVGEQEVA